MFTTFTSRLGLKIVHNLLFMLEIKDLVNGNKEIIVPKGIRYISDWADYSLLSFSFKHILDKKIPGCGYTEYCLRCNIPIILCSPRKILLENKESQHPDSVLYFKNELDEDSGVDKDLTKPEKAKSRVIVVKPDPIKNQEILDNLNAQLMDYLRLCDFKRIVPKILVTYDSFRLVKEFLGSRINEFYIVVDEFQSIFVDSRFKSDTELGFIDQLRDLCKVCYVSATPMIDNYLKLIDEFKDLPYYELDWYTEDPLRVVKPDLEARVIHSVQSAVAKIVDEYRSGKYEVEITKNGIVTSKEAVFYVNSVTNIISIIKKCNITPDECNILCAKTAANETKIERRLGRKFKIGRVPLKGEPHKMFTFCTRTVYLGADFYSTNARTFIFSDANVDSLAVDITLDLPQILGRQRLSENPWKNRAKLYYKTLRPGNKITQEEFNEIIKRKEDRTESLLRSYDRALNTDKHNLAEEYKDLAKLKNYRDHYVAVNVHGGKDLIPTKNKLVKIAEQRAYDIQQIDYKDRFSVFNTLVEEGQISEKVSSGVSSFISQFNSLVGFPAKMRFLCESDLSKEEISVILDQIPLQYKNFYLGLGPDRCKALSYNVTRLSKELSDVVVEQVDLDKLSDMIYKKFKIKGKYTRIEIKDILKEVYSNFGYNRVPKASDLEGYFELSPCQITNKTTGKRDHGFEIIKKKGE